MVFKLITNLVILCLFSTISCATICYELQHNNESSIFAFTQYYGLDSFQNIKTKHILVINDKVWNIRVNENRITIEGFISQHFIHKLIKDNYNIAVRVIDMNRDYTLFRYIQIYFNGTTFYYIVREGESGIGEERESWVEITTNTSEYKTNVPFSDLSVAFIPDSFRHDFDKQLSVVFVEQKQSEFRRKFYILKFTKTSGGTVRIKLEDPINLPKFLAQLPDTYYINGILNTYEYKRCIVSNNCSFSAIVLFTVNGIMKYCITSEDDLSENCLYNAQPLIECIDWMHTKSTTTTTTTTELITTTIGSTLNLMTTSIKPKDKHKNGVFVTIIIILSIILIVCIISCLSAYLIYRYCAKRQPKKLIVIKGNKKKEEIEEQKKKNTKSNDENENDLTKTQQTDITLKEESQETFGFDTTDQKILDLNEPIYVNNRQ